MTTLVLQASTSSQGAGSSVNTTTYSSIAGVIITSSNEGNIATHIHEAGTFSNLYVRISANSISGGASTFNFRNQTTPANLTQTLSIPASTTGEFEDTVHTDTITVGNRYDVQFLPGDTTNTLTYTVVRLLFNTVTNTATRMWYWENNGFTAVSTSYYFLMNGGLIGTVTTESNVKMLQNYGGTFQNLTFSVNANTRTTTTTFVSRKDTGTGSVNGNLTISVPNNTGGTFEDTVNTDSVSPGNYYNLSLVTGSDSGHNCSVLFYGISFVSTAGVSYCLLGSNNGNSPSVLPVRYFPVMGGGIYMTVTPDTNTQMKAGEAKKFSQMTVQLSANGTGTSTMRFRKNATNGNMVISVPPSTTGAFTDATNVDFVVGSDEVNYSFTPGTASGITINSMSSWNVKGTSIPISETLSFLDH